MRIGVFGGTFDPPHLGHSILADESRYQLKLDKLLWVLTSFPPHKIDRKINPPEQRLTLVQAAIKDRQDFVLSRVDLDRSGPYYALDTMRLLQVQFPGDDLFYLIGGDSFHDLPAWHKPHELINVCAGFGIMRRPGDAVDVADLVDQLPGIKGKLHFINTPLIDISSTVIRKRIKNGEPYRYYLLQPVYEAIEQNGYYR